MSCGSPRDWSCQSVSGGWPGLALVTHTRLAPGSTAYQTRPAPVTSSCHCSSAWPPTSREPRGRPGGDAGGGDSLASSAVIARCRKRFGSAQGLVGTTLPNPWRLRSPRTAAAIRPGRKGALLGLPSWAPLPCARSRDRTTITWQRAAEVSGQSGVSVDGSCRLPVCEHGD